MKTADALLYLAAIAAASAVVIYVIQRTTAARTVRNAAWSTPQGGAPDLGLNNGGYGPGAIDWGV